MSFYDYMNLMRANPNDVSQRHPHYLMHHHQVELVRNVYEGSDMVKQYLFQFPQEQKETWELRKDRATLRNFVKRAVEAFSGMVFRKPLEVVGYPVRTTRCFDTIDTKNDLNTFAKHFYTAVTRDGKAYILIDAPNDNTPSSATHPYFVLIERQSLINWRKDINGNFTMVVIEELIAEPVGEFGTKYIRQWRHIDQNGMITVYRRNGDTKLNSANTDTTDFYIYSQVQSQYPGIPMVEVTVSEVPILYDIAQMNIKHYNRQSHKDRYLTMAALPIPVIWGADIDDDGTTATAKPALVIGVDEAFIFTGTKDEADFQWRELSGDSIEALEKDLDAIVEDITTGILRAAETANAVQKTATEVALLQAEASNRTQTIANAVEAGLRDALAILTTFNNERLPDDAMFKLSDDFNSAMFGSDGVRVVMESYLQGLISIDTYLKALSDAELISIESTRAELERIKNDKFVPVPPIKGDTPATASVRRTMDNRTVSALTNDENSPIMAEKPQ